MVPCEWSWGLECVFLYLESLSVLLVESVDELHDGYQGEEFDLCKSPVKVVLADRGNG